jgi:hypothetical protein
MKKISITIMCDYCADGIWINGAATVVEDIYNLKSLSKRFENWQEEYESFNLFNKNRIQTKVFEKSNRFKRFVKEGANLTILVRKRLPGRYKVVYFNEKNNKRYILNLKEKRKFKKEIEKTLRGNYEENNFTDRRRIYRRVYKKNRRFY